MRALDGGSHVIICLAHAEKLFRAFPLFPPFFITASVCTFRLIEKRRGKGKSWGAYFQSYEAIPNENHSFKAPLWSSPPLLFSDDSSKRGRGGAKAMRQGTEKKGLLQFAVCCSKRRVAVITCFLFERGKSSAERMSCLYFFFLLKLRFQELDFTNQRSRKKEDFVVSWRHSGKRHKS